MFHRRMGKRSKKAKRIDDTDTKLDIMIATS